MSKIMDQVMSKAVEIGELVRETDECKRLLLSNQAFEADLELKKDIGIFEESRSKLMQLEQSGAAPEDMEKANDEVMKNYEKIMVNPTMVEVTDAKQGMDEIITNIVKVIGSCIIGPSEGGCDEGSCAGCSGCSN
jgi:cell fate (sporulation/competence/biofilm development) regulator YlbF (YheA/YmcA/DUF963 family)